MALYDDLCEGLQEAIEYETGKGTARKKTLTFIPLQKFSNEEIKGVRQKWGMTQTSFAGLMGVSKKTVEAWECGRTHPTGPACRLLYLLSSESTDALPFVVH